MTENLPKSWRERAAEAAATKADHSAPSAPPEPAPVVVPQFDVAAEFDDDDLLDEDDTDN